MILLYFKKGGCQEKKGKKRGNRDRQPFWERKGDRLLFIPSIFLNKATPIPLP
jgi:hypothetical protein